MPICAEQPEPGGHAVPAGAGRQRARRARRLGEKATGLQRASPGASTLGFDAVGLADAEGVGIANLLAGAAEGDTVAVIAGEPSA